MKKIMYHIHTLNIDRDNDDKWEVGNTIDNTDDDFINTFFKRGSKVDAKSYCGDKKVPFVAIINGYLFRMEEEGRLPRNVVNMLINDSNITIRNRNVLIREIALEQVRKEYYPNLISRKNCIWLCDLDDLKFWRNQLSNNIKIFKIEIDGDLFVSSDSLLPDENADYETILKEAHNYWNPVLKKDDKKEYLFRGKLTILEELSLDKIADNNKNEEIETEEVICNRLVRDNIPNIIETNGKKPIINILNEVEYQEELLENLSQEISALNKIEDKKERLKKCAEMTEIIKEIVRSDGYTETELVYEQEKEREKSGGFTNRVFLKKVVD